MYCTNRGSFSKIESLFIQACAGKDKPLDWGATRLVKNEDYESLKVEDAEYSHQYSPC